MRVVPDAVVFVRALINRRSIWGQVLARAGEFTIVTSPDITLEVLGVLRRSELQQRLFRSSGPPDFQAIISLLVEAESVTPGAIVPVCRDPNDDKYFACAVAGNADYIVSEDEDILAIPEHQGVTTIRAAAFIRALDGAR